MKRISKFFQKILFNLSLSISQEFRLEYNIVNGRSYGFFLDLGPKMLIIRNNKVWFLGSALSVVAEFDEKKDFLFCKPRFLVLEKGDKVFYGKRAAYRQYAKYTQVRGIEIIG